MALRKPTSTTVSRPDELLAVLIGLYEAVLALQNPAPSSSSIVNLGALQIDPGIPPQGTVYEYTINGSLKCRTRTGTYVLAA
jgi:hypothetical protein